LAWLLWQWSCAARTWLLWQLTGAASLWLLTALLWRQLTGAASLRLLAALLWRQLTGAASLWLLAALLWWTRLLWLLSCPLTGLVVRVLRHDFSPSVSFQGLIMLHYPTIGKCSVSSKMILGDYPP